MAIELVAIPECAVCDVLISIPVVSGLVDDDVTGPHVGPVSRQGRVHVLLAGESHHGFP